MEITELLLRGAVRDPRVEGALVSEVHVSDDLQHARVYVRLLQDADQEAKRQAVVEGLNRAAGHIRRQLAPKLKVKYLPDLRFFWDEGVDRAVRVEQILAEIRAEDGSDDKPPE